ncbi:uncharacterized protein LOC114536735 [Dendronephthya gigantea]|uniref:uncharacterized protein LOC114536735 n=1 Tax=Dendronephthya gigantea TaxID=151771 RepID=UPI00106D8B30|nr:uncharacterized protein LOC114536735 [Dendronephthya gigantea]
MKGEARKDLGKEKNSHKKTGGGRPHQPLKPTVQRILELFGDEPSFCGIQGGIESGTNTNWDALDDHTMELPFAEACSSLPIPPPAVGDVPPSFLEKIPLPVVTVPHPATVTTPPADGAATITITTLHEAANPTLQASGSGTLPAEDPDIQEFFLFLINWLIVINGNIMQNATCDNDGAHPLWTQSYFTMQNMKASFQDPKSPLNNTPCDPVCSIKSSLGLCLWFWVWGH